MKILWLTTRLPYPANSGGNLVVYPRLKAMEERGHEIHLACPLERSAGAEPALAHLHTLCASVTTWPRRRLLPTTDFWRFLSLPWAAYSRFPPPRVADSLRVLAAHCDVLQVEHSVMWPVANVLRRGLPHLPVVLTVHADARAGLARLAKFWPRRNPRRYALLLEAARAGALERSVLADASLAAAFFVSGREHDNAMRTVRGPSARFHHLPIGYPARGATRASGAGESGVPTVLLVASFLDPGNREAAHWMVREVWPKVRAERRAVLEIAGRNAAVLGIAGEDIRITSDPENLDECYQRADCCVVPVFGGSGVRVKLLEAAAYGNPIVTTTLGVEGTMFAHGQHVQIADDASTFAASVLRCLDRDPAILRAAEGARNLLERDHAPETISGLFEQHLLRVCAGS
jgi:glycosyltransferase involved in cell wall biosynthesis